MNKTLLQHLKALCLLRGPSGREEAVRDYLIKEIGDHAECRIDPLGNLLVHKSGHAPATRRLLLSAHMDEVGFIVTHIDEKGFLRFAPVGGIQPEVTGGRAVLVGDAPLYGVIGCKATHLCKEKEEKEPGKIEEMWIDIGATDRADAEAVVAVGDMVTFASEYRPMGEEHLAARAIDDRAGCAMLLTMIQGELPCDCDFSFTVQEETGCFGAKTAAFALAPEIAVAVEGTTAGDLAGVPEEKRVCRVGGGPVVSFMDKGTVYDYELYRTVRALAKENGISAQTKEGIFGGNESRSLMTAGAGCRILAISVPVRYLHSASSVAALPDIEETFRLLMTLPGALAL